MRGSDLPVTYWLDPDFAMPTCVYLDSQCVAQFLNWLGQDKVQQVTSGVWKVVIFKHQLNRIHPQNEYRKLWNAIRAVGIQIDTQSLRQTDEDYIMEAQRAYFHFHEHAVARLNAEFLALVRKRTRGTRAAVLSQNVALRRIPELDTFFVPGKGFDGSFDLPAQFDFYQDMKLHKQLKSVVDTQLANGQYPDSVLEACKLLFDYIRSIDPALTSDGGTLADEALKLDYTKDKPKKGLIRVNGTRPKIELNHLATTSEGGEQQGYYRFVAGIADAFRNLNAHHSATDPFIISRFGDKQKALKVLCFISLVLEKLDERLHP